MSSNCSVVVADDNREAADTLVEILAAMGYPAIAVYDGREAARDDCVALGPAPLGRADEVERRRL